MRRAQSIRHAMLRFDFRPRAERVRIFSIYQAAVNKDFRELAGTLRNASGVGRIGEA
jgi:hypothetical protein